MTKYLMQNAVIGLKAEMGQFIDGAVSQAPFGLYFTSDTAELYICTGSDFTKISNVGITAASAAAGFTVAGALTADTIATTGLATTGNADVGGALQVDSNGQFGDGATDSTLTVKLNTGQTALGFALVDHTGAGIMSIAKDGEIVTNDDVIAIGTIKANHSVTEWGASAVGAQPAITGNVTTGLLSDLQGVVGLLLTALAAKGTITNSTT